MGAAGGEGRPRLGIGANAAPYALLVLVGMFVGGMVGLERAVVPLLAEREFGLTSRTAILGFIIGFGLAKALANLVAGVASDRFGRRRVLIAGWLAGLPVPFLIMAAPDWGWVVIANVLLGVQQGLCWSATVIMQIDLVGPVRRGLAMGVNEATSCIAVSLAAVASGYLAGAYAPRPQPFYLGVAFAVAGLLLSALLVRETHEHARHEARGWGSDPATAPLVQAGPGVGAGEGGPPGGGAPPARAGTHATAAAGAVAGTPAASAGAPSFARLLLVTSWRDRTLFSASQVGFFNNLNDGMAWGLLPLHFAAAGLDLPAIGLLAAIYPGVWGVLQFATGPLSDHVGRRGPIVAGMGLQAAALALLAVSRGLGPWGVAMALLGVGTALVYPSLIGAVSDVAHPDWRARTVGVYRLWRDTGYAVGALAAGLLADRLGAAWAIGVVAALTLLSGAAAAAVMRETLPARGPSATRRRAPPPVDRPPAGS